jgi:hypothetical protein
VRSDASHRPVLSKAPVETRGRATEISALACLNNIYIWLWLVDLGWGSYEVTHTEYMLIWILGGDASHQARDCPTRGPAKW